MRIITFNVNGIKSFKNYVMAKYNISFNDYIRDILKADILCLQEVKSSERGMHEFTSMKDYISYTNLNKFKNGIYGVSTFVRKGMICSKSSIKSPFSEYGRSILTEHVDFKILNVYFPFYDSSVSNGSYDDVVKFYVEIYNFLKQYDDIIVCGDFNAVYSIFDHYLFYDEFKRLISRHGKLMNVKKIQDNYTNAQNENNERSVEIVIESPQNGCALRDNTLKCSYSPVKRIKKNFETEKSNLYKKVGSFNISKIKNENDIKFASQIFIYLDGMIKRESDDTFLRDLDTVKDVDASENASSLHHEENFVVLKNPIFTRKNIEFLTEESKITTDNMVNNELKNVLSVSEEEENINGPSINKRNELKNIQDIADIFTPKNLGTIDGLRKRIKFIDSGMKLEKETDVDESSKITLFIESFVKMKDCENPYLSYLISISNILLSIKETESVKLNQKINFGKTELEFFILNPSDLIIILLSTFQRKWMLLIILELNFVDSYRMFNKELEKYTCWNTQLNLRPSNKGTRIDYVLVPIKLYTKIQYADIMEDVMGSDHCPVFVDLDFEVADKNCKAQKNNILDFFKK